MGISLFESLKVVGANARGTFCFFEGQAEAVPGLLESPCNFLHAACVTPQDLGRLVCFDFLLLCDRVDFALFPTRPFCSTIAAKVALLRLPRSFNGRFFYILGWLFLSSGRPFPILGQLFFICRQIFLILGQLLSFFCFEFCLQIGERTELFFLLHYLLERRLGWKFLAVQYNREFGDEI